MRKILATEATVEALFEHDLVPYQMVDAAGAVSHTEIPGWKCRGCGWQSLQGVRGLPFGHECDAQPDEVVAPDYKAVATGLTNF